MKVLCSLTTVIDVDENSTKEDMFVEFVKDTTDTLRNTLVIGRGIESVMFEIIDEDRNDSEEERYLSERDLYETESYEDMYDLSDDKFLDASMS